MQPHGGRVPTRRRVPPTTGCAPQPRAWSRTSRRSRDGSVSARPCPSELEHALFDANRDWGRRDKDLRYVGDGPQLIALRGFLILRRTACPRLPHGPPGPVRDSDVSLVRSRWPCRPGATMLTAENAILTSVTFLPTATTRARAWRLAGRRTPNGSRRSNDRAWGIRRHASAGRRRRRDVSPPRRRVTGP